MQAPLSDGTTATVIVCGSRRPRVSCSNCGQRGASRLCDGPRASAPAKTCDRPLCLACATNIGPEQDLCPEHYADRAPEGLRVQTARLGFRGENWLDITRKAGSPFAPSDKLLWPYIAIRKTRAITSEEWEQYRSAYVDEMRMSFRKFRAAWDRVLAMPRVVLLCFCSNPAQCHRLVLARDILPKLGAVYAGEVRLG